jgi:hypothetical protein
MWRRVDVLVLEVNGVIILVPLVHLSVGLEVGRVRADEATVTIVSRWTTHCGATRHRRWEAMLLTFDKLSLGSDCQQCNGDSSNEALHFCGSI